VFDRHALNWQYTMRLKTIAGHFPLPDICPDLTLTLTGRGKKRCGHGKPACSRPIDGFVPVRPLETQLIIHVVYGNRSVRGSDICLLSIRRYAFVTVIFFS